MDEPLAWRQEDGRWTCVACVQRCTLAEGEAGVCGARTVRDGRGIALNRNRFLRAAAGPVEGTGFLHLFPGTRILALGSWGDPFAQDEPPDPLPPEREPERVVALALELHARGLVLAYSEPAVWAETALDLLRLARAQGLYTAAASRALTPEVLEAWGPYLDGLLWGWQGPDALPLLQEARARWKVHVEIYAPVLTASEAGALREALGDRVPLHLWDPALPHFPGPAAPRPTPPEGFPFIYLDPESETRCPGCGRTVVRRSREEVRTEGIAPEGTCEACGADLAVRRTLAKFRLP